MCVKSQQLRSLKRENECSEKLPVAHSPVDGIHPIGVRGSYEDPLHICKDSHELPPAHRSISAMHGERFWFQHYFFGVLFKRLQVHPLFWSADSQVASLDRAMRERHLNMKKKKKLGFNKKLHL